MNGLYLECEGAWGNWKDKYKVNVLCIANQNHERWAIVVDHSSKFKIIYSMVHPPLYTNVDKRWILDESDEIEIRLLSILGGLCTQVFHS